MEDKIKKLTMEELEELAKEGYSEYMRTYNKSKAAKLSRQKYWAKKALERREQQAK